MKIPLLITVVAFALLAPALPAAHADDASNKAKAQKQAQIAAMLDDDESLQMACHEMLKSRKYKIMAIQIFKQDKEFTELWQNSAAHGNGG